MKKNKPTRKPPLASAKELEQDARAQIAYLDAYKPRPQSLETELRQIMREDIKRDLDRMSKADAKKLTAEEDEDVQKQIAYLDNRDALTNHLWGELLGHLHRGNLTAAHYLLTNPAYLGSFIPGSGPKPPATVEKQLARLGIKSRQALHAHLDKGLGAQRGKVLSQALQTLAGACCFGEMLALLPYARQALHAAPDNKDCQEAVALACEAMLHLPPDNPKRAPGADLISLRQRAAGIKAKPTRKPAKAKPRRKS
jgi:hypothetical protein